MFPLELPAGRADIPNFMAGGDTIGGCHLKADDFSFGLRHPQHANSMPAFSHRRAEAT
jgi:hypothetical protein